MALLILEQLDRRVDQQWINTAPIAGQKDLTGMGSSYFERLASEDGTPAGSHLHIQSRSLRLKGCDRFSCVCVVSVFLFDKIY